MISARRKLLESLRDRIYRQAFVEERARSSVALQIRALREQRQLTQNELARSLGMAQAWVSKLENPDYGKMTVTTLLRLAEAFDTDLEIKFRPFSETIDFLPRQSSSYFSVPSFAEEFEESESSSGPESIGSFGKLVLLRQHGQGGRAEKEQYKSTHQYISEQIARIGPASSLAARSATDEVLYATG